MKLYLVRHATATDKVGGLIRSDGERPLTDAGKREAQIVAMALRRLGIKADAFLYSPLVRARQTAEIFAEVFALKDKLQLCAPLAPGGAAGNLYEELKQLRRANELFLFGHEPDISRLAQTLLWAGPELNMPFKKAAVCRIDIAVLPPTFPGELKWFITPKIAQTLTAG